MLSFEAGHFLLPLSKTGLELLFDGQLLWLKCWIGFPETHFLQLNAVHPHEVQQLLLGDGLLPAHEAFNVHPLRFIHRDACALEGTHNLLRGRRVGHFGFDYTLGGRVEDRHLSGCLFRLPNFNQRLRQVLPVHRPAFFGEIDASFLGKFIQPLQFSRRQLADVLRPGHEGLGEFRGLTS